MNILRKELSLVKSENVKKNQEIQKKDKVIEQIVQEVDSNPLLQSQSYKAKEAHLISSLQTQFKETKNELELKKEELAALKKHIKNTKFNELSFEVNTLTQELAKLKRFYDISLHQNSQNEDLAKKLGMIEVENIQQKNLINNNSIIISSLEEELKKSQEEIYKLKKELEIKSTVAKNLIKQLGNQKEINDRFMKNRNHENMIAKFKKNYEKQINDMNKEIKNYSSKIE